MRINSFFVAITVSIFSGAVGANRSDFVLQQIDRFNPAPKETDPLKEDKGKSRLLKLCKLADDPWLFYRGTNHLYWADFTQDPGLTQGPQFKEFLTKYGNDKTRIWLQGDLHAENFGAYDDAEGEVVYGLNDFDESLIADYRYDVWRMAISLVLVANQNGNLKKEEQEKVVETFARSYLTALESFEGTDDEKEFSVTDCNAGKPLKKFLKKTESSESRAKMLEKQTTLPECAPGTPEFDTTDGKNVALADDSKREKQIRDAMTSYRATLADANIGNDNFFKVKDVARRVGSGTGGLNAERYYMLIEGESASHYDDRILDIKEQTEPSPLQFLADRDNRAYQEVAGGNHAKRHLVAYQALVASPDPLLGWMELPDGTHFSVRERSPYKESFRILDESKQNRDGTTETKTTKLEDIDDYEGMAKEWGRILATAHARSDKDFNDGYIDYSFEKHVTEATKNQKKEFAKWTAKVAMAYADRVAKDHAVFAEHFKQRFNSESCGEL